MLKLLKNNRCKICYTERMIRPCIRKKKDICWICCNNLRYDAHCPESCAYGAKFNPNSPFPTFKADSGAEAQQVLKLHIDLWVSKPNPMMDSKLPSDYAATDQVAMLKWLSGFQFPPHFPLAYLMQKLGLKHDIPSSEPDPEEVTAAYLAAIIRLDWNDLRAHTLNQNPHPDLKERYAELIRSIPTLSKISTYSVIHSGLGEDGHSALVYLELNHKQDWTIILSNSAGPWKVRQQLAAGPEAYFKQNQAYAEIANALGKGEDGEAWELINQNLKLYPDSPDLHYYRGLYWQLVKQPDQAAVDYFNAIALDNNWPEPYMHLANLCIVKKDYPQAREWLIELLKLQPDNPQALNNLAAAYAGEQNTAKAKELWEKLLKQFPTFELARKNLEKLQ